MGVNATQQGLLASIHDAQLAPLLHLYFDTPADEEVWRHPLQWALGDAILAAPVTEPGASEWSTWSELAQIFAD